MVDKRIDGLGNTHHSSKYDAPCVGAVESAGGSDGDGAEQDGRREGRKSDISAGDVFLERLARMLARSGPRVRMRAWPRWKYP